MKNYTTYDTKEDLRNAVYINGIANKLPKYLMDLMTDNIWNNLTEKETALAVSILRETEPVIGYKIIASSRTLKLDWQKAKRNIIRALQVYSWANGNQIFINGEAYGEEKDIYLYISPSRIQKQKEFNSMKL